MRKLKILSLDDPPSFADQMILDCMQKAVTEALEHKKRLGQYAVIWQDGRPVTIGGKIADNDNPRYDLTRPVSCGTC